MASLLIRHAHTLVTMDGGRREIADSWTPPASPCSRAPAPAWRTAPGSNTRLASGIAPVRAMRDAGVPVSLAVDGSASNDSGHLLAEMHLAMLLQRVAGGAAAMGAREVLEIATLGGARVLGSDDIGALAPGMAADCITVPLDDIGLAGALGDPVAALALCQVPRVRHSLVAGRVLVHDGALTTVDLPTHVERHNRLARHLADAAHGRP